MASNRSLAEHNLSQQPKVERNKQVLIEAHQNKALIQEQFDKNRQKLGILFFLFSDILFHTAGVSFVWLLLTSRLLSLLLTGSKTYTLDLHVSTTYFI